MRRENFKDPFNGCKGYYHLSTPHQETRVIFRSDADFIYCVNTFAILCPGNDVQIISYCLMDNHIHILLAGRLSDCLRFFDKVVHRMSLYFASKYKLSGLCQREDLDIVAITSEKQLKYEICYIHRNPYKARIASPYSYRWSSSDVYFTPHLPQGTSLGTMSVVQKRKMFNTKKPIPDSYEHENGLILNSSFVAFKLASSKFRNSVEYFDLLRRYSIEAEVETDHGLHEAVVFSDIELKERINMICTKEFYVSSIAGLDRKNLLRLARVVAFRYGAGASQIARILGVGRDVLERVL